MNRARKILTGKIPLVINVLLSAFKATMLINNNRTGKSFCHGKYRGKPTNGPETQCNILKQTGL